MKYFTKEKDTFLKVVNACVIIGAILSVVVMVATGIQIINKNKVLSYDSYTSTKISISFISNSYLLFFNILDILFLSFHVIPNDIHHILFLLFNISKAASLPNIYPIIILKKMAKKLLPPYAYNIHLRWHIITHKLQL